MGILRQTQTDLELIIVDDCSLDNSWDVIRSLAAKDCRIRTIRHDQNLGASKSRNDGLHATSGQFIGFCDADDIWERDKLEVQLNLLRDNPGFDAVYCDAAIIDESGLPTRTRFSERFPPPKVSSGFLFRDLVACNFINMQSVLIRKECLRSTGYFDEEIKWVEDWWYWIRLSRHHRFLYSPQLLARYRMHSGSTSLVQKRGYHANRFKVLRRILGQYADLPSFVQADVVFKMGVALCKLGKLEMGRRLLWGAVRLSMMDLRAFSSLCRSLRHLIIISCQDSRPLSLK